MLLVVYVDDFRMSGPEPAMKTAWETIRRHFKTSEPQPSGPFLGCNHKRYQSVIRTGGNPWSPMTEEEILRGDKGVRINVMEYDMEDFLDSSVLKYCELAEVKRESLPYVETPFIDEREAIRQEKEAKDDNDEIEAEFNKTLHDGKSEKWTQDKVQQLTNNIERQIKMAERSLSKAAAKKPPKPLAEQTDEKSSSKNSTEKKLKGVLQPIASRILMKVLYAARVARWDLLRAIGFLATQITKWTVWSDMRLHRIMAYINSSLKLRMLNWVSEEDDMAETLYDVYADADFAGADLLLPNRDK